MGSRCQGQAGLGARCVRTLDIGCRTGSGEGMNDPEVTMSNVHAFTDLIAVSKALEAAGDAIALVTRVPAPLKSIADQVIRSASSVPANLAEGHGRSGRDRLHLWRIAYASAKEVDCHLRLLARAAPSTRRQGREGPRDLRSGPRHDLAAAQPEDLTQRLGAGSVRPMSPETSGSFTPWPRGSREERAGDGRRS